MKLPDTRFLGSILLLLALFIYGCNADPLTTNGTIDVPDDGVVEYSSGEADLSNFVAIGNSLTAGFADGALYDAAQQRSFPAMLAQKFAQAGGSAQFNQPDINSVNGCNTSVSVCDGSDPDPLGRFKLDINLPGPSPTIDGDPITPYTGDVSALNNFGVPGIQVGQLLTPGAAIPGDPAFSGMYARFASNPGSSTILGDAIATQPTFFTLWAGSNDVLGYAASGATNNNIFTSEADFEMRFGAVVSQLMDNTNAKGVVLDIPPMLYAPYFRLVPYNPIEFDENDPVDVATVNQLNAGFSGFNEFLDVIVANNLWNAADAERRKVTYELGANPILIRDPNLASLAGVLSILESQEIITPEQRQALTPFVRARQLEEGELALFTAAQVLGTLADPEDPGSVIGVAVPLAPQHFLAFEDIDRIEDRRMAFNSIIANTVNALGGDRLALYETDSQNSVFSRIFGLDGSQPGVVVSGERILPDFTPFGAFSTDGVHPAMRGHALIANEILDLMESEFDAILPRLNVLSVPTISTCIGDCVSNLQSKVKVVF